MLLNNAVNLCPGAIFLSTLEEFKIVELAEIWIQKAVSRNNNFADTPSIRDYATAISTHWCAAVEKIIKCGCGKKDYLTLNLPFDSLHSEFKYHWRLQKLIE